jgi:hypothetical protein
MDVNGIVGQTDGTGGEVPLVRELMAQVIFQRANIRAFSSANFRADWDNPPIQFWY